MYATQTDSRPMGAVDFRHEALFYEGDAGFVEGIAPFVRDGVAAGEAVLVVVSEPKIEMLRAELDGESSGVLFADMAEVGRNPARIIPAWREFLDNTVAGRGRRGVGEPIWAARTPAELVESQRHEALLNVAFSASGSWRLLCPYDTGSLPPTVIAEAARSHPFVRGGDGVDRPSPDFSADQMPSSHLADELDEPARVLEELVVGQDQLARLRAVVARRARRFGMEATRVDDLTLAVHEIAANSVFHGGGVGVFRLWRDGQSLVCEVRDKGRIAKPLVGRERPDLESVGGRGLWLANQICDLVQIRSFPRGAVVRLHMSLADA